MKYFKKIACALLVAAVALSACACSRGESSRGGSVQRPTTKEVGKKGEASNSTQAEAGNDTWAVADDPVLLQHDSHNQEVSLEKPKPVPADKFDVYIENTQALEGYTSVTGRTEYQDSVQSAFTAANAMFEANAITSHTLTNEGGDLQWQAEASAWFRNTMVSPDFYKDNILPEIGPLEQLFRNGNSPFSSDRLTAIVTNLAEPGFELGPLYQGIENYFDACDHSAVAVVGFTSRFDGYVRIPTNGYSAYGTTFYVEGFNGNLPAYILVAGPEVSVREYVDRLAGAMESKNIQCGYSLFTNSVHERAQAKPLRFVMVEDLKVRKLSEPTYTSFNTGSVTWNDAGTAFFLTDNGCETRGETITENGSTAMCTQLTLVSENYDGVSDYGVTWNLQVLDKTTGQWVDAGKDASNMVRLGGSVLTGELIEDVAGQKVVILTSGNKQVGIQARLNFDTDSVLSRSDRYRLEVQLQLDQPGDPNYRNQTMGALSDFSVTGASYYQAISKLCTLSHGNYNFRGGIPHPEDRDAARYALERTPNLEAFLKNLEKLEDKYPFDETVTQYVDLILNLPGQKSKR